MFRSMLYSIPLPPCLLRAYTIPTRQARLPSTAASSASPQQPEPKQLSHQQPRMRGCCGHMVYQVQECTPPAKRGKACRNELHMMGALHRCGHNRVPVERRYS